jgi:hypothetical protein
MKAVTQIISAVNDGDIKSANEAFANAIKEKVNTILDIKKIALTSEIFNKAKTQ